VKSGVFFIAETELKVKTNYVAKLFPRGRRFINMHIISPMIDCSNVSVNALGGLQRTAGCAKISQKAE